MKVFVSVVNFSFEEFEIMCAFKTMRAADNHAKRCEDFYLDKSKKRPRFYRSGDWYSTQEVEYYK